jgi:uncharacterized membrane protein YoaK (UPF0700 family)
MISKLPRWVWAGGWMLAFIAGMLNVVAFLGFEHHTVSHLTGASSMLGAAVAARDLNGALHFAATIGAFLAGTIVSGLIIQDCTLSLGRRYGLALLMESGLLVLAVLLLERRSPHGYYLVAGACGLQNAMATTYSGAIVRTTHVSGMFTDLGISIGHALRGVPVESRRLRLCCIIISAFLCGSIAGAQAFPRLGYSTLLVPAALTGVSGLGYAVYRFRQLRKA